MGARPLDRWCVLIQGVLALVGAAGCHSKPTCDSLGGACYADPGPVPSACAAGYLTADASVCVPSEYDTAPYPPSEASLCCIPDTRATCFMHVCESCAPPACNSQVPCSVPCSPGLACWLGDQYEPPPTDEAYCAAPPDDAALNCGSIYCLKGCTCDDATPNQCDCPVPYKN